MLRNIIFIMILSLIFLIMLSCADDDPVSDNPTTGTVAGYITDSSTSIPVHNATISLGEYQTASDENGIFVLDISVGTYQLSSEHADYEPYTYPEDVIVTANDTTTIDLEMISIYGYLMPGMVLIESGGKQYEMGSETGFGDEMPVHEVNFTHDFWMDESEVTQARYDSVMTVAYPDYFTPIWNNPYGVGDDYPAYEVEWGDGVLYCNALSRFTGLDSVYTYDAIIGTPGYLCELENVTADLTKMGYRLPTEAEWEYACRGNSNTDFFWQKDYDPYPETAADSTEFNSYAVWYGNSWQFGGDSSDYGTHPVKTTQPNDYGLYDLAGNVWEWCHDWYGAYSSESQTDPVGPGTGSWHSIRGGSWANQANYLRATNRTFSAPCYYYYLIGFRTVLTKFE